MNLNLRSSMILKWKKPKGITDYTDIIELIREESKDNVKSKTKVFSMNVILKIINKISHQKLEDRRQ